MLTYRDSSWAVRRWDWFNKPWQPLPLSYCQFWRTVLVYATIKWLLTPLNFLPTPLLWLLLIGGRTLWLLALPLRSLLPLVARPALAGGVRAAEPIVAFGKRHKEGLGNLYVAFVCLWLLGVAGYWLVMALLASLFWTLIGGVGLVVISFAAYGFIKSGALGLLWQAAIATHHGICPPVEIIRG